MPFESFVTKHPRLSLFSVWLCRTLIGVTFIFSGFVKAVDPWGTLYKFNDYLAATGFIIPQSVTVAGVFLLCCMEFLTGWFVLWGCFRKLSAWCALLIMAFMLPLSLWIAVADPVEDCGCFGDAWIISNNATLIKNIFLTIAAIWLVMFPRYTRCLVTPALQWIVMLGASASIMGVALYGYIYQPLIDFRPYPIGSALTDNEDNDESEFSYRYIYRLGDSIVTFSETDDLPDESEGWTFVERKEIPNPAFSGKNSGTERQIRVWSEDGTDDVTDDVILSDSPQIIMLIPDLSEVSIASTWQINSLYTWASRLGIDMIAVAAGSERELENWKDISMPSYPIYTSEDTAIKEVARGNPAVIYLEDGIIRWKSSLRAIDTDDFLSPGTSADPMSFARDNNGILLFFLTVITGITGICAILSLAPWVSKKINNRLKLLFRCDDTVHREE